MLFLPNMVFSNNNTCRHILSCGGCVFSQDSYSKQLVIKENFVAALFENIIDPEFQISPIIPSPVITKFRNKMEFSFYETLSQKGLGLMGKGKFRKVIPLEECLLIDDDMFSYLKITQQWWNETTIEAFFPPKNIGFLCSLVIRKSYETKEIMLILNTMPPSEQYNKTVVSDLFEYLLKHNLRPASFIWNIKYAAKGVPTRFEMLCISGKPSITEKITLSPDHSASFTVYPDSFFQPNSFQLKNIIKTILEFATPCKTESVLDLYCGSGVIGTMLSRFFKKVLGIEIIPDAIKSAKENIINNRIINMEVILEDAKHLKNIVKEEYFDTIVIDPPRCGIHPKTISSLLELLPKKIIYISCNPITQHSDILLLLKNYFIEKIQPIDQFPHSNHLENVILLKKRTS